MDRAVLKSLNAGCSTLKHMEALMRIKLYSTVLNLSPVLLVSVALDLLVKTPITFPTTAAATYFHHFTPRIPLAPLYTRTLVASKLPPPVSIVTRHSLVFTVTAIAITIIIMSLISHIIHDQIVKIKQRKTKIVTSNTIITSVIITV